MNFREICSIVPKDDEFYSEELTQVAVSAMLEAHPIFSQLEFYTIIGNAENRRKQSTATGGVFRTEGSDYTAAPTTPVYVTPTLKVFGDRLRVDQAYARRGLDIPSLIVRDTEQLARNIAYAFVDNLINADGTGNKFVGIRTLAVASGTVNQGANGAVLPNGNSDSNRAAQQAFFETLDRAIALTRPGKRFLIVPDQLLSRMTNVYREAFSYTDNMQLVGQRILTYMGIPVISAGYNEAGNPIMPFNETLGTSTNCSSIYVVSVAEGYNYSIASNSGFSVSVNKAGVLHEIILEGDFAPTLHDDKSIARFNGIRLST